MLNESVSLNLVQAGEGEVNSAFRVDFFNSFFKLFYIGINPLAAQVCAAQIYMYFCNNFSLLLLIFSSFFGMIKVLKTFILQVIGGFFIERV